MFFVALSPFFLNAQHLDFGVTAAVGSSFASSKISDNNPGLSYNLGFLLTTPIAEKIELGGGLNISHFSIKENNFKPLIFGTDIVNVQNGILSVSYLKVEYRSFLTFVSIPIYLRYSLQKFAFYAGIQ